MVFINGNRNISTPGAVFTVCLLDFPFSGVYHEDSIGKGSIHMTVKEAAREEWAKLKGQPFTAKLKYIFTYYGIGIGIGALVLVMIVSLIVSNLTAKEQVLQFCLLNAAPKETAAESLCADFLNHAGFDPERSEAALFTATYDLSPTSGDSAYATTQMLLTRTAAGELDILGCPREYFQGFSYNEFFADLSEFLTAEQLQRWSHRLVYMDRALLQQSDSHITTDTLPDPYDPTVMTDPVPVGIRLEAEDLLTEAYRLPQGDYILGVIANTPHSQTVLTFLEYILN